MTTHDIQVEDPLNAVHLLINYLKLQGVTSYVDVYFPSIEEYENNDMPKIHLTAEELPWNLQQKNTQR